MTALTSSLELDTFNTTGPANFIPYDSASIELIEGEMVRLVAGREIPKELIGRTYHFDLERWAISNLRQPIIIPDVRQDDRFEESEESAYIRSWMGIPLYAQDSLIGFTTGPRQEDLYRSTPHSSDFANQAAIAIHNAHLFIAEQQRDAVQTP
jgi:GAF domain-containing protein